VIERTLSIIKPDAVAKNIIGEIIRRLEAAHLKVVAIEMRVLSKKEAEAFYGVHRERPFYNSLVAFVCSGPVVVFVLEGENAILSLRKLIGATDPRQAEKGTLRADYGDGIEANVIHASDSVESASFEVPFFFG